MQFVFVSFSVAVLFISCRWMLIPLLYFYCALFNFRPLLIRLLLSPPFLFFSHFVCTPWCEFNECYFVIIGVVDWNRVKSCVVQISNVLSTGQGVVVSPTLIMTALHGSFFAGDAFAIQVRLQPMLCNSGFKGVKLTSLFCD